MEINNRPNSERLLQTETEKDLINILGSYTSVLWEDSTHVDRKDLAIDAQADLDKHLKELEVLQDFIEEFGQDPSSFDVRSQRVDQDTHTVGVKLKRKKDANFGIGEENALTELSFHVQYSPVTETIEDASYASALSTDSDTALTRLRQQLQDSKFTINTVKVFSDPKSERIRIRPQAGIQLAIRGEQVYAFGVNYVGSHPHIHDVRTPPTLSVDRVLSLHQTAANLARQRRN